MNFNLILLGVIAVIGLMFTVTDVSAQRCLPKGSNQCTPRRRCCRGWCDTNNGAWRQGVCR